MTLRGRLTTAFLAVVLGPVLLGSLFVGMTVATVSRDRTVERLDHAATTVRTGIGAVCRQLQAVADSVAVLPPENREAAAGQMVRRGLASAIRIEQDGRPAFRSGTTALEGPVIDTPGPSADPARPGSGDPTRPGSANPTRPDGGDPAQSGGGVAGPPPDAGRTPTAGSEANWRDCAAGRRSGGVEAIAASASTSAGEKAAATEQAAAGEQAAGRTGAEDGRIAEGEAERRTAEGGSEAEREGPAAQAGTAEAATAQAGAAEIGAGAGRGVGAGSEVLAAGMVKVSAALTLDSAFIHRLAASSGAEVTLLSRYGPGAASVQSTADADDQVALAAAELPRTGEIRDTADGLRSLRRIGVGPGQPLPLIVSIRGADPGPLYLVLLVAVVVVGVVAVVAARLLARSTTRPLADLVWAVGRVADGELDTRVPVRRLDEVGLLADTFNRMTRELQAYVQALTASRDQLRGHLAILGDTLSSTHDLRRILEVILQTALSATGARAGAVLLIDPVDHVLVVRCSDGLSWDDDVRFPIGEGVLGAVAATGEPRRGLNPGGEPACHSYIAVPISAPATVGDPLVPGGLPGQSATLGVLALYDRLGLDEFDDADLLTLRTFAGQTGVAVHNVRIHEEAQRLSLTDPLTGLWNYRYLRESLRREVERAARFGRTLTVLVLDLDHFKHVNDTYGHAAGDAVLVEFARLVRLGLREVDVAFRQGGEEFAVLLPETDAYGGTIVAERLAAAIRDNSVQLKGREIKITVSIGIAVFPEHGATAQQVLDAADDALYCAKDAGRDTYRLAGSPAETQTAGLAGKQTLSPEETQTGSPEEVVSPGVHNGNEDPAVTPQTPRHGRGR